MTKKELNKKIVDEVNGKVKNYEARQSWRLAKWTEVASLYMGREFEREDNFRDTPNSTELFSSVRSLKNMAYRMLTSQRPFFELESNDIIGFTQPERLIYMEKYIQEQLELSNYTENLRKALTQLYLYGTVAIHETYEPMRQSMFGAPVFVTTFKPMSLVNCAFAMDGFSLSECGWVALTDITSKSFLDTIIRSDKDSTYYDIKAVQSVIDNYDQKKYVPEMNTWTQQRLAASGYYDNKMEGGIELRTYYGTLDCLNDSKNYLIEIVNGDTIIRKEEYIGIRPVRIATINEIDVEPLGSGLGDLFRPLLKQMDETKCAKINTVNLMGANMFVKSKNGGEEDVNWQIRNFGILELDGNIAPLSPNPSALPALANEYATQIQEYRRASGASDTLQAMVSGEAATATEVSLAMNEAVRNISVDSEMLAIPLVKDHIRVIIENAFKYQTTPLTLGITDKNTGKKVPVTISPDKLKFAVGVRVKTMTDQDFRPTKINKLLQTLQFMSSIPQNALTGYKIDIAPVLMEILKTMDVPHFDKVFAPITEQDLLRANIIQRMQNPQEQQGQAQLPNNPAEQRIDNQAPGRKEQRAVNGANNQMVPIGNDTLKTPTGQVLQAPGDISASLQAQRSSVTGIERK